MSQYHQCTLIANFRNFSNPSNNSVPTEVFKYISDDIYPNVYHMSLFGGLCLPAFYANGNCKDNEGYVSTMFCINTTVPLHLGELSYADISCTVAVRDVSGNKRFLQTFVYRYDDDLPERREFGLEKYLKRETLLNDPTELLPRDCLTIYAEINYVIHFLLNLRTRSDMLFCSTSDEGKNYISLDSDYGKKLCKVSEYFQRASDVPMIENNTRRLRIPSEERQTFILLCHFLDLPTEIKISSIAEICDLYTVADKYSIQWMLETCREWIKSVLCGMSDPNVREHVVENIPMVLELSEKYGDRSLKEIVEIYLKTKNDLETSALEEELKDKLSTRWKCVYDGHSSSPNFKLIRILEEPSNTESFQFYK